MVAVIALLLLRVGLTKGVVDLVKDTAGKAHANSIRFSTGKPSAGLFNKTHYVMMALQVGVLGRAESSSYVSVLNRDQAFEQQP